MQNDRLRFSWELGAEGVPPVVTGIDIGQCGDGCLSSMIGVFDIWPATEQSSAALATRDMMFPGLIIPLRKDHPR